ncbi:GTPase [Campylobacter sp. 2018MI13]|uniref:GTPase family protein n=1 Tax=Campylobacter sp. 2018MI13 TaxID=2836737 RepID=UPI001BD9DC4A|nr:GTPase [Campylobacter sp. 2018MI13]MBT0883539.1 50S ribosome-binding GTPase [Campylobacter sp. 2018MI13]
MEIKRILKEFTDLEESKKEILKENILNFVKEKSKPTIFANLMLSTCPKEYLDILLKDLDFDLENRMKLAALIEEAYHISFKSKDILNYQKPTSTALIPDMSNITEVMKYYKEQEESKEEYTELDEILNKSDLDEEDKTKLKLNIKKLANTKLNILITGGTGVGKSSTINSLFNMGDEYKQEFSEIGTTSKPQTMEIKKYEIGRNLVLWDSPGLGDGIKDSEHIAKINKKLHEKDSKGNALIDLVLVIVDAKTRDLGTTYHLITNVIIPALGENAKDRILIALNKCDQALEGDFWVKGDSPYPEEELIKYLDESVKIISDRIYETTSVRIEPIYYSSGKSRNGIQENPYNLGKLLDFIIDYTPSKKRAVFKGKINENKNNWKSNEKVKPNTNNFNSSNNQSTSTTKDYKALADEKIEKSFWDNLCDGVGKAVDFVVENKEKIMAVGGFLLSAVNKIFKK